MASDLWPLKSKLRLLFRDRVVKSSPESKIRKICGAQECLSSEFSNNRTPQMKISNRAIAHDALFFLHCTILWKHLPTLQSGVVQQLLQ